MSKYDFNPFLPSCCECGKRAAIASSEEGSHPMRGYCNDHLPESLCGCGKSLDENGEHSGGYGAWCGSSEPPPSACQASASLSDDPDDFVPCQVCSTAMVDPDFAGADGLSICDECREQLVDAEVRRHEA